MVWKAGFELIKETFDEWGKDHGTRLAAALSFYVLFSMAPLLVIVISVASMVFDREAVRSEIFGQIESLIGPKGADAIRQMVETIRADEAGTLATVLGLAAILFGASGAFFQLQNALNTVWGVRPKPGRWLVALVKKRLFSLLMVLGTGFLLVVSLIGNAGLAAITRHFQDLVPGFDEAWSFAYYAVSFLVTCGLFALVFKVLPDAKVRWRDVGVGALVTAVLFTVGQVLLGLYLGRGAFASAYGAAGSFVIILMWVYYSSQILLMGAEFTQVYARRHGKAIEPSEGAYSIWTSTESGERMKRAPEDA